MVNGQVCSPIRLSGNRAEIEIAWRSKLMIPGSTNQDNFYTTADSGVENATLQCESELYQNPNQQLEILHSSFYNVFATTPQ